MTRPVILSAGKASRMGDLAPGGCKALVVVDGRPIIEQQLAHFDEDAVIVCRTEHQAMLSGYGEVVVNDRCAGPGDALTTALRVMGDDPITVVYADTLFDEVPSGSDWIGVGEGHGGRSWDVLHRDGKVNYEHVAEGTHRPVCVGLYSFGDLTGLREVLNWCSQRPAGWGMGPVVSSYPHRLRREPVTSWRDAGTAEAVHALNQAVTRVP